MSITNIAKGVNNFRNKNRSFLGPITHYQRLLEYMHPDYIHVLNLMAKFLKSGDIELANQLGEKRLLLARSIKQFQQQFDDLLAFWAPMKIGKLRKLRSTAFDQFKNLPPPFQKSGKTGSSQIFHH
ncbi:MAG: hypothetical protein CM1200mP1_13440 [Candidatus Neomarinimicrobiota bacterium]|nr:MAG: hypothetical protein CM1200mP1_13440 [Candidatus Neomarinimicrobiota bacterium]